MLNDFQKVFKHLQEHEDSQVAGLVKMLFKVNTQIRDFMVAERGKEVSTYEVKE